MQIGDRQYYPAGMIPIIPAYTAFNWTTALTLREGDALIVTITAAGPGNLSYLTMQADRF